MIGELMRLIRVFNDLTLSELSKNLDISVSYLSEIENGKKQPTLDFVKQFANHFKIRPSAIMFFIEEIDRMPAKTNMKDVVRKNFLRFLKYVESGSNVRLVEK